MQDPQLFGLGVGITASYAPILFHTSRLIFGHKRPRMAWIMLLVLVLVRIASGIIAIISGLNTYDSKLLATACIALLSAGVFPLLLSYIGMLRIIAKEDYNQSDLSKCIWIMRLTFLLGLCLLIIGICIRDPESGTVSTVGTSMAKAGSIVSVILLLQCAIVLGRIWMDHRSPSERSIKIVKWTSMTLPFLAVRIVYLCLSRFSTGRNPLWNMPGGSTVAFVCMALVPEYIVLIGFVCLGFYTLNTKKEGKKQQQDIEY